MAMFLFDPIKKGNIEIRKKKHWLVYLIALCQHSFKLLKKALTSKPVLIELN